jgi:hypothetical protein
VNGRAIFLGLLTIALVIVAPIGHGWALGAEPELITFTSGELALKGVHLEARGTRSLSSDCVESRSEKFPGTVNSVAPYLVSRGYVFFVAHPRGQGRSPGPYIMDQLNAAVLPAQRSRMLVALHEVQLQDQLAGPRLSQEPYGFRPEPAGDPSTGCRRRIAI